MKRGCCGPGFVLLLLLCGFALPAQAGLQSAKIAPGASLRPQKIALFVGIDRSLRTKHWSTLRYAKRDARRMAARFRHKAQFDKVILLDRPSRTTTQALLQALARLQKLVTSPEDMVVVYISAHGTVSQGRERYIVTADTTQNVSKTGLSVTRLRSLLRKLVSRRLCLILATCYSGSQRSKSVRIPGAKGTLKAAAPLRTERAIQILSAASFAQSAFESNRLKADIYTHFFLDCFRALAHKTIIKIHVCAATKTTPYVQRLNGEVQVPKAYSELGANYDFALVKRGAPTRKVGYFRGGGKGVIYRIFRLGRKGKTRQQAEAKGGEYTALLPGRYQVWLVDRAGKVLRREHISISSGHTSPMLSHWALDLQFGAWGTSGILKQGGDIAGTGYIGIRHPFFAVQLGVWSTMVAFEDKPFLQLAADLRLEGGYTKRWQRWSLFGGAFATLSLLLQDLNQNPNPVPFVSAGLTAHVGYWPTSRWGICLHLDAGAIPRSVNLAWRVDVAGSARLGLRYRFE